MPIFGAPDTPILDFWGSKLEWTALFALGRGICDIHSLRFTSGATPLPVYVANRATSRLTDMCVSTEVECWTSINSRSLIEFFVLNLILQYCIDLCDKMKKQNITPPLVEIEPGPLDCSSNMLLSELLRHVLLSRSLNFCSCTT